MRGFFKALHLYLSKTLCKQAFNGFQPNLSNPHKFGHSCSILENNVLMHQCAIAQRISKQKPSPIPSAKQTSLLNQRSLPVGSVIDKWVDIFCRYCAIAHQRLIFFKIKKKKYRVYSLMKLQFFYLELGNLRIFSLCP